MESLNETVIEAQVQEVLRTCYDPEIPVDIVNLGLVYEVLVEGDRVEVKMTTTAAGCPVGNYMVGEAKRVLARLEGVKEVDVELVYDPPWQEKMISEEGRRILGWRY